MYLYSAWGDMDLILYEDAILQYKEMWAGEKPIYFAPIYEVPNS